MAKEEIQVSALPQLSIVSVSKLWIGRMIGVWLAFPRPFYRQFKTQFGKDEDFKVALTKNEKNVARTRNCCGRPSSPLWSADTFPSFSN